MIIRVRLELLKLCKSASTVQNCTVFQFGPRVFWRMPSSATRRVAAPVSRFSTKPNSRSNVFDLKYFLDSAGLGRKVTKFEAKETVFGQGDAATNVMYIQEGGVKLSVVNEVGKEAVVSIYDLSGASSPLRLTVGGNNRLPIWSGDDDIFVLLRSRQLTVRKKKIGSILPV